MTPENDPDGVIGDALEQLSRRSEVVARLVEAHGPYLPRRALQPDVFASLARAIIYQQLAGKAAAAIHRRFEALVEAPMSAAEVLSLDPDTIRGAGLSRAKRDAVIDLARHTEDGSLDIDDLDRLDDEAVVRSLCRVRGIGPWTAQMFLLFELGRLDVWPTGDLGVRRGFGRAFAMSAAPSNRELEPLGDAFRPYRSIVAWYCWRVTDTPTPAS